jgi:hypothetical protein
MNANEMNGHGEKYSRLKEIALAALLNTKTLEEAAQKGGISVSTLRRWLKNPDFRKDYDEERRYVLETATSGLSQAATDAIRVLRANIICPVGEVRDHIMAANAILNVYNKEMQRFDTQRRLSALEQKVANDQPESIEDITEESEYCGDEVNTADTPGSLPDREILVTETEVTELRTQMNADGRKKGSDEKNADGPSRENTDTSGSLLKRRILGSGAA